MLNNPIIYTDPTGNTPINDGIEESLVTNVVVLHVDRPYALNGIYGPRAQYVPVPSNEYRKKYPDNRDHYNLCGHLSFTAIYETETGIQGLGKIWEEYPTDYWGELTDADTWAKKINGIDGWTATTKSFTRATVEEELAKALSSGTYIMFGCTLDKNSPGRLAPAAQNDGERYVGHFAVLIAISDYGVTIYNPYTNFYELYSWFDFKETYSTMVLIDYEKPEPEKEHPEAN